MAKYKFIGTNGSMGLTKGRIYNLNVIETTFLWRVKLLIPLTWRVVAWRVNKPKLPVMPYSNLQNFYKNWERVGE